MQFRQVVVRGTAKVAIELIEVQIGSCLGEDDIIRTDDAYHRAPGETR